MIPDTAINPEEILNAVADTDFYILKDVKLSEFVTRQFIEGFIKRGKFLKFFKEICIKKNLNIQKVNCVHYRWIQELIVTIVLR